MKKSIFIKVMSLYMSDVWYDGRYFNSWEFFENGATFAEYPTSDIVIKDAYIPIPADTQDRVYCFNTLIYNSEQKRYVRSTSINDHSNYNVQTGIYKGFTRYEYDAATDTWVADIKYLFAYRIPGDSTNKRYEVDDPAFLDACTLTREEVAAMGIDRNTNTDPTSYYNYDMTVWPGTKVG